MEIGFAKDSSGQTVTFDPTRNHTIICGATRSGKSVSAMVMLSKAAATPNIVITGVDPSGLTLSPFDDAGQALITTGSANPVQFAETLENLVSIMTSRTLRLREMKQDKLQPDNNTPTILIVLEEYAATLAAAENYDNTIKPKGNIKSRVLNAVGRLLRESAKVSMYVFTIIQRPDSAIIGGADRDQYSRKLTHRVSTIEAAAMLNDNATKAELEKVLTLPAGVGLLNEAAAPLRFYRSALLTYPEYVQYVAAHYQPNNIILREINLPTD
jgi:hypothetical protein